MKTKKVYFPQINVIKAIASFSVTAVHFRNRVETTIPEAVVNNKIKMFFSINYALFIFAVPLFLIATGFLSTHKKTYPKKYYWNSQNLSSLPFYGFYIIWSNDFN